MKLINTADMKKEDWLKLRKEGLGGSEMAAIMGFNPYCSPLDIYEDKVSDEVKNIDNKHTRFGLRMEDVIADWWSDIEGRKVRRENKMAMHDDLPLFVNIDRLILKKEDAEYSGNGPLEIKTTTKWTYERWFEEDSDVIPIFYPQLQHAMGIYGYDYGCAGIMIAELKEVKPLYFERNDEFIEQMWEQAVQFWFDHVVPKKPPEPRTNDEVRRVYKEASGEIVQANEEILKAHEQLKRVKDDLKELKQKKETLEVQVKNFMGNASFVEYMGDTLFTWKQSKGRKKFDKARLKEEKPDIYDQYEYRGEPGRRFYVK